MPEEMNWCPDRELNTDLILRRDLFYPLNYRGTKNNIRKLLKTNNLKTTLRCVMMADVTQFVTRNWKRRMEKRGLLDT